MRNNLRDAGWRGAALVGATYVYFLIFAQFGFLARLAELGIAGGRLHAILATMAAGGICMSLLAPRLGICRLPAAGVRAGLVACAVAAVCSVFPLGFGAASAIAALIGVGLGVLTVSLVTHLRGWVGERHAILKVGMGTGIAYFVSNVPWVFTATPRRQAELAALLCIAGLCCTLRPPVQVADIPSARPHRLSFPRALSGFLALVWLDSAAFYIIQHTPALKAGTWTGSAHLWTNGSLHLFAAVASAMLLQRQRILFVLGAAFGALGAACLLLRDPAMAMPASLVYPAGVSLYSVALVAYPSFLTAARGADERARQAAWIYAVAGWGGSSLGIGMAQNLGRVPEWFVAASGAVVMAPALIILFRTRIREFALVGATCAMAWVMYRLLSAHTEAGSTPAERGRQVYVSEGCIHCHSQFVRPNTSDVPMWGPAETIEAVRSRQPPLIGNRRQGPDLSQIGARRSPLWLKAHLIAPSEISGGSIMPSYAILFHDSRGDDLVAYLESLRGADRQIQAAEEEAWLPSEETEARAEPSLGEDVYRRECATCHDADGQARQHWRLSFRELPADLAHGPFRYLDPQESTIARAARLERIAKFGIPGTDMPGHEYLSDRQIRSLTVWLMQQSAQPVPHSKTVKTGDD